MQSEEEIRGYYFDTGTAGAVYATIARLALTSIDLRLAASRLPSGGGQFAEQTNETLQELALHTRALNDFCAATGTMPKSLLATYVTEAEAETYLQMGEFELSRFNSTG